MDGLDYKIILKICACRFFFFFSSRRRHTRFDCDWSSDVCSSDLRWLFVRHVPDAPDRPQRRLSEQPARLHGVPRLEGIPLVLARQRFVHVHAAQGRDRKSTRLNSSHSPNSYAVFCLKKKKKISVTFLLNIPLITATEMLCDLA